MAYRSPERQRSYAKLHYERNKGAYKQRAKRHTAASNIEVQRWLTRYLEANPCVDCGESDPIVLEFDHTDRGAKRFCIGDACSRGLSLAAVVAEVAKCAVRCANCHRRKTYKEMGHESKSLPAMGSLFDE